MPPEIKWLEDWDAALAQAAQTRKNIFLDFFLPT